MIAEERLQELEQDPRGAMPCKAELRELAAAYRAHSRGPKVKRGEDGVWLHFEAQNGKKASIRMEVLIAELGPIVRETIRGWVDTLPSNV